MRQPTTARRGRMPYSPRRGLASDQPVLCFEQVLALHQPVLSHAAVGTSGWPPLAELPTDARQAVLVQRPQAATSRDRGGSWYRKAFTVGRAALDLHDPGQLDLLRRCGPFSTDARVWVEGDPVPVIESTETLDGAPRFTYRLDPVELERLRAARQPGRPGRRQPGAAPLPGPGRPLRRSAGELDRVLVRRAGRGDRAYQVGLEYRRGWGRVVEGGRAGAAGFLDL